MKNTVAWFKEQWIIGTKIGVIPSLDFSERLKVELSNQFALFGIPLVMIHALRNVFGENLHTDNLTSLGWVLYLGLAVWLNYKGKRVLARYWLIIFGTFYVLMIHVVFGPENRLESLYILVAIGSLYFFKQSRAYSLAAFVTIMYLIGTIYSAFNPPILAGYSREGTAIEFFVFTIFIVSSLTSKILRENYNYQQIILEKNDILTKKNEQLKRFNYIVSHDLKEPIRAIVSFSNLLKREQQNEATRKEFLDYIIRSGRILNNLIEDIRIFQDLDGIMPQYTKVSLAVLIEEAKEALSEIILEKKANIQYGALPSISTSKSMLMLVFKNLIENAVKYNTSSPPIVSISIQKTAQDLCIYIKDNGIGIEEQFFEEVFVMFKRLNAQMEKGSGLGLNIARNIIERLDGELKIWESSLGEGSTFMIKLPLAADTLQG